MPHPDAALPVWPVAPDWSNGVRETLAWSTQILRASATATSQHVAARIGPRRSFSIDLLQVDQERRIADMLLFDRGARPWLIPIWPDVQWLQEVLEAGASLVPCRVEGFDFVTGGLVLLYRSATEWEVATVDAVEEAGISLASPLERTWGRGCKLYPLRRARLLEPPRLRMITDSFDRAQLRFLVDEPSDWPATLPEAEYLGAPVLETGTDWSEDSVVHYSRETVTSDNESALPTEFDVSGVALRNTPHVWQLWGRQEQSAFRSLLYGLRGRQVPIWVPSGSSDLLLSAPVGAASSLMTVQWCGYFRFGRQQVNRRDICIALRDGTRFYRRIVGSAEQGVDEVLELSQPLGQSVDPGTVSKISFICLSTLASDEIELHHMTDSDGCARAIAPWKAVVPDA